MIRVMLRWVAVLLLALLPFQFVWASVGNYCKHEQGSAAWHFGHHAHVHSDASHDEPQSPTAKHTDCGTCKLHASALGVSAPAPTLPASTSLPSDQAPPHISTAPPNRIERPNWASLAV